MCRANSFHDQDVLLCPRLVVWAISYISPVPQGPWRRDLAGARGDRRVVGRVRARGTLDNFTLTKLISWADGLGVEGSQRHCELLELLFAGEPRAFAPSAEDSDIKT